MNAGAYFEVQDAAIKSRKGDGAIIFQGMQNHTADSIKSLEGYDCAWVEEAQSLSQTSLDLLRPTIRKPDSELWFTWNPRQNSDPVDALLRGTTPPKDAKVIQVNFSDNPWFPDVLKAEMEFDRIRLSARRRCCAASTLWMSLNLAQTGTGRITAQTGVLPLTHQR
jgi:phage terminase large subunit